MLEVVGGVDQNSKTIQSSCPVLDSDNFHISAVEAYELEKNCAVAFPNTAPATIAETEITFDDSIFDDIDFLKQDDSRQVPTNDDLDSREDKEQQFKKLSEKLSPSNEVKGKRNDYDLPKPAKRDVEPHYEDVHSTVIKVPKLQDPKTRRHIQRVLGPYRFKQAASSLPKAILAKHEFSLAPRPHAKSDMRPVATAPDRYNFKLLAEALIL